MIPISDVVGFYTGSTVEAALAEVPYKLIAPDGGINPVLSADKFAIPLHLEHAGDPDTRLTFTDDDIEATVGGLSMLKLTEAGQDLITLGPGSGDVDINFNGDMLLEGSTGRFGIGETTLTATLHTLTTTAAAGVELYRADASEGGHFRVFDAASTGFIASFEFLSAGINGIGGSFTARVPAANDVYVVNLAGMVIDVRQGTSGTTQVSNVNLFQIRNGVSPRFTIDVSGNVGMNSVTSPSTELDIGAGAMEFAEMTAPAAGAANTARDYAEDDGSGNTRRRIKFSSGNAVTIAQDGGLQTYTPTNVVTDRSYDANATSVAELADVLGTLIADFQAAGVLG
jgi:hypothetical protein